MITRICNALNFYYFADLYFNNIAERTDEKLKCPFKFLYVLSLSSFCMFCHVNYKLPCNAMVRIFAIHTGRGSIPGRRRISKSEKNNRNRNRIQSMSLMYFNMIGPFLTSLRSYSSNLQLCQISTRLRYFLLF